MAKNRMVMRLNRWGLVAVVFGILLFVNLLASFWFARVDLTEDKEFTPSADTRALLAQLDDNLLIRGYFTANLPPPYNANGRVLKELLDEYRILSGGLVEYEFVDPATLGENAEQEMNRMGIPQVQVTDISSDRVEVKNGYMGAAVLFEDRMEVIPVIQGRQGLEYLLTSKIGKVTNTGRKKVAFLQGDGIPSMTQRMSQITGFARERYEVNEVDLEKGAPFPDDLDVLMVAQPQVPLSDWALSRIDRFLAGGGSVGFFGGGVSADLRMQIAQNLDDPLAGLLSGYGIQVENNVVLDSHNLRITVSQQRGIFTMQNLVDYPYIPVLTGLSAAHPVVGGLENIFLPFVSRVVTMPLEGVEYTTLAESSPESWLQTGPYNIDPFAPLTPHMVATLETGPHVVAVSAEGIFPSRYAGTTVNLPESRGGAEQVVEPVASAPGRMLVVGSGDILRDDFLMNGENLPFIINSIDWLARDEGLIGLRSRGVTDRPLETVSDGTRQAIKAFNMLAGAGLLIVIGLIRWKIRSLKRRDLENRL